MKEDKNDHIIERGKILILFILMIDKEQLLSPKTSSNGL
jgi:hypothetical protein